MSTTTKAPVSQQIRVLREIKSSKTRGRTDYEVSTKLGILRSSASMRRRELELSGLIHHTEGIVRPTDTGTNAKVWTITPRGLSHLDTL